MAGNTSARWADVDAAIEDGADAAFAFLERLVAAPGTVGAERGAQDIVAAQLALLGFVVTELAVPEHTAGSAPAGVAQCAYAGRPNVLGRINPGGSPSLLLNGHVDVVPADAAQWSSDPFVPVRSNPVRCLPTILSALASFEAEINASADDAAFGRIARPYNVNVGTVAAGDWASSVPAWARMRVRVGFPRSWTPGEAFERVSAAVLAACADDPGLASRPTRIRQVGFRAEGYLLDADHPLAEAMARAHTAANGAPPEREVIGSTTDARYYLNQFGRPALAYGPRARHIHAADEAVELASIVSGAKALARFIAGFFASGGLRGQAAPRLRAGT